MSFWKFVSWEVNITPSQAASFAEDIKSGRKVRPCDPGGRFFKMGGWCFDLCELAGYKPYLIKYHEGGIEQAWGRNVGELREQLYLSRRDKVAANPFATA